jgi:uncharacterized protein (TIGR04255 family)
VSGGDATQNKPVGFLHPPLNEVIFSVQFETSVIDEVVALSDFRPTIVGDFPDLQKHPPLLPVSETFDFSPPQVTLKFESITGAMPQRYWFLSPDQTKIIQVQPDRLLFNWRQVEGSEAYPRYDVLAPEFFAVLQKFLACCSTEEAGTKVAWVELQYVNAIEVSDDSQTHGQLARILNFLVQDPPTREVLPEVEDTQLQQRFRICDDDGKPRGRLYLSAVPGLRQATEQRAYIVTLLARGRPDSGSIEEGVSGFLATAHRLIVNGFREVTTKDMHHLWEEL